MALSVTQQTSLARESFSSPAPCPEIRALSPQMISRLSSAQITELTKTQWRDLTPLQMTGLTRSQIEVLAWQKPDRLRQLIDPSGITGWSCAQFGALSLDALEAIPPILLAQSLRQKKY